MFVERLTHERVNRIKTGYWAQRRKKTLVQRLAVFGNEGGAAHPAAADDL